MGCHPKGDQRLSSAGKRDKIQLLHRAELKLGVSEKSFVGMPIDAIVDPQGKLFIADALDGSIKEFDTSGTYIATITKGRKMEITGICLDDAGNIYASDLLTSAVHRFSNEGAFLDSIAVGEESRFVLGIPRVYKDKIFIGVLDSTYGVDFYKSTIVGIYNLPSGQLIKRFGKFDDIYAKYIPLSPEVHFDVGGDGTVYVIQCHSYLIRSYDSEGNPLKVFGEQGMYFRQPSSARTKDREEYFEWLTTWSNMNYIKVLKDMLVVQYFDRAKAGGGPGKFKEEHYISLYTTGGEMIDIDIRLPGTLIAAKDDLLYVGTDLESQVKTISVFEIKRPAISEATRTP